MTILVGIALAALTFVFVATVRRRPVRPCRLGSAAETVGATAVVGLCSGGGCLGCRETGQGGYPESLTAVLPADAEEYLAWLADDLWPDDEYLELDSRAEGPLVGPPGSSSVDGSLAGPFEGSLVGAFDSVFAEPFDRTVAAECPGCHRPAEDIWPCRACGRLLHSACGHGMRRRKVTKPYRMRGTHAEMVVAEWYCTGCAAIVGLDVDHDIGPGDDRGVDHA